MCGGKGLSGQNSSSIYSYFPSLSSSASLLARPVVLFLVDALRFCVVKIVIKFNENTNRIEMEIEMEIELEIGNLKFEIGNGNFGENAK